MRRRGRQLSFKDYRMRTGRGGPRPGAGRPRAPRARVLHRTRVAIAAGCPVHVTLRVRCGVPRLRTRAIVKALRRSFAKSCERGSFRLVHYSIQRNHAHLIVEASGKRALASGMKSIAARFARCVNRVFHRSGPVRSWTAATTQWCSGRRARCATHCATCCTARAGMGRGYGVSIRPLRAAVSTAGENVSSSEIGSVVRKRLRPRDPGCSAPGGEGAD